MQKTPNIAYAKVNVSMNRQFSVYSVYNFTRNNLQITYILAA